MPKRDRSTCAVYILHDAEPGVQGVIRYSGDPDEFAALAHAWLIENGTRDTDDVPVAVLPPEPRLYRMNAYAGDEYGWTLGEARAPGYGVWTGALLRTIRIGCDQCRQVHGRHAADCLNRDLTGLITLQFESGTRIREPRFSPLLVHAVRDRAGGTPGPTLCGINRFDRSPQTPGWSVGGGHMGGDLDKKFRPCSRCTTYAQRNLPGLTISGALPLATVFAATGVPLAKHLVAAVAARRQHR